MEHWAEISDYPNYLISSEGRVYSRRGDRILKPRFDRGGYLLVNLYNEFGRSTKSVHRLVAEAFLEPELTHFQVNHRFGDKTNNRVEDLEWSTPSENVLHAFRTGLRTPTRMRSIRIIETDEVFESTSACARAINGSSGTIGMCLSGRRRTHLGYTFEYVNTERR